VQTWRPLTIDTAGIHFVAVDADAAASLAVLPGPSVLSIEAEAGLLAAGVRPLRGPRGIIVAALLRDGTVIDFVPDAAEVAAVSSQGAIDSEPSSDVNSEGIEAMAQLYGPPRAQEAGEPGEP